MTNPKPLIDSEGEVRELTREDFARAIPLGALPEGLQAVLRRPRGPQAAPRKDRITIRLAHDTVARFRATGPGWQARIDQALRDWLATQPIV
jgi:uncharacterized protein (DUF4415 family)